MEDGAWKPSSYLVCLACRFFCFTLVVGGFCVIVSRTVVSAPRPPTPNMFARLFTPLHKGRGKPRGRGAGEGLLLGWVLEDGAQRPPSYYDMPCSNRFVVHQAEAPPQRKRREGGAFVINPLLAKPFTPLHRSTFGRLPEQEGEGKAAQAARGWGFYSSSSLAAGNFMIAKPLSVRPTYSHSTLSLPLASFSTK